MQTDVLDLRAFYATRLGQIARRYIQRALRRLWPDTRGLRILAVGYPIPYLRPFLSEAERVVALMPAGQGVMPWPAEGPNIVALSDEHEMPLPDAAFDRVLITHSLESTDAVRPFLRQVWRVLTADGRLIVVAPNRASLWAQIETTPFGHGRPFTRQQLSRLLGEAMFAPESIGNVLYMPPFASRLVVRTGAFWEGLGARAWPSWSGVLVAEATKCLYGLTPAGGLRRVPLRARALEPMQPRASQPRAELPPPCASRRMASVAIRFSRTSGGVKG